MLTGNYEPRGDSGKIVYAAHSRNHVSTPLVKASASLRVTQYVFGQSVYWPNFRLIFCYAVEHIYFLV